MFCKIAKGREIRNRDNRRRSTTKIVRRIMRNDKIIKRDCVHHNERGDIVYDVIYSRRVTISLSFDKDKE